MSAGHERAGPAAEEMLIGFDARRAGAYDPSWDDDERRRRFLLRRDVPRPLSVDRYTWPSLADVGYGRDDLHADVRERLGIGWNQNLWVSLDRLKRYLAGRGTDPAEFVLVAVGWLSRLGFPDTPGGPYPWSPRVEPARPENSWILLGYDVADPAPFSGLSDCGYTPAESERLREEWAPRLNEHHLFTEQEDAFTFVEVSNERVPEHAPFHVFSLYRLE
jgi:hypothetical protein